MRSKVVFEVSDVLPFPPELVWLYASYFGDTHSYVAHDEDQWQEHVKGKAVDGQRPSKRFVYMGSGRLCEEMTLWDENRYVLSWKLVPEAGGEIPFAGKFCEYRCTLRLQHVTLKDSCFVKIHCSFVSQVEVVGILRAHWQQLHEAMLQSLQQQLTQASLHNGAGPANVGTPQSPQRVWAAPTPLGAVEGPAVRSLPRTHPLCGMQFSGPGHTRNAPSPLSTSAHPAQASPSAHAAVYPSAVYPSSPVMAALPRSAPPSLVGALVLPPSNHATHPGLFTGRPSTSGAFHPPGECSPPPYASNATPLSPPPQQRGRPAPPALHQPVVVAWGGPPGVPPEATLSLRHQPAGMPTQVLVGCSGSLTGLRRTASPHVGMVQRGRYVTQVQGPSLGEQGRFGTPNRRPPGPPVGERQSPLRNQPYPVLRHNPVLLDLQSLKLMTG